MVKEKEEGAQVINTKTMQDDRRHENQSQDKHGDAQDEKLDINGT